MEAFNNEKDFGELLVANKVFTQEQVKELFDLEYYSQNIDAVFKRMGL